MSEFPDRPVQVITKRLADPEKNMEIFYPAAVNMADQAVQQKINSSMISLVDKLLADQGYYTIESWNNINGWFEIKTNQRNVLSLTLYNYAFPYHYAHGLTLAYSLTFDTNSGESFALSQMFKPGSDYVKILSEIIKEQIRERNIPLITEFNSIKPDQDYYIADKCLVIYFQVYEYTAYYQGFQFFPISVYEIQEIVAESSPLGRMIPDYYISQESK